MSQCIDHDVAKDAVHSVAVGHECRWGSVRRDDQRLPPTLRLGGETLDGADGHCETVEDIVSQWRAVAPGCGKVIEIVEHALQAPGLVGDGVGRAIRIVASGGTVSQGL